MNVVHTAGNYKTLTKAEAGRQPDAKYDRQRFDNYTAWLDLQVRAKQSADKVFQGKMPTGDLYGFRDPMNEVRSALTTPKSEPFLIQEPSFTSGETVRRLYDKQDKLTKQDMPGGTVRTDPWHYPNSQAVHEPEHFDDYRRASTWEDAKNNRPEDKERAAAVSDEMVKQFVFAATGAKAAHVDATSAAVLFGREMDIRPSPETLKEGSLNVDLSCARMPKAVAVAVEGITTIPAASRNRSGRDWSWCMDKPKKQQTGFPSATSKGEQAEIFSNSQTSFFGREQRPNRARSLTDLNAGPGFIKSPEAIISLYPQSAGSGKDGNLDSRRTSPTAPGEAPVGARHLQGGKEAINNFAGSWSVDQGHGPGIGQFHVTKPARNPFLGGL